MTSIHAERLKAIENKGGLRRAATVVRSGIDTDTRTVELAFSSETDSVERWFGVEILGHASGEVNLARLNNSAPILWNHDWHDQRGVIDSAWIGSDGVGRALVRFSRSPAGDQLYQDIADGIISKVSVGYSVEDMAMVEERDGVAVYRVTAWTPFEISMVSVPADDTVGVGRSLPTQSHSARIGHPIEGNTTNMSKPTTPDAAVQLSGIMVNSRTAPGPIVHFDGSGKVRGTTGRTPASVGDINILSLLPAPADPQHLVAMLPAGTSAGQVSRMDMAISSSSVVLASGAHLIVTDLAEEAKPLALGNGEVGWEKRTRRFDIIDRAPFQLVNATTPQIAPHAARITSYPISMDAMQTVATRVELSRRSQRMFASEGVLASEVLLSIALGLGNALDKLYLDLLLKTALPAYSLAAVAAGGHDVAAIRAMVGTAATGAVMDAASSELRVQGLRARMTAAMSKTVALMPTRSAIAIDSDIRIIAQRTNLNGNLALTAMASALPIIDRTTAWEVRA